MKATVYTTGKLSKSKGVSVAAAVIEGLPEGPVKVSTIHRPHHPTPNSVAVEALMLGVSVALSKGATELEVFSSSKNAVKATDGTGGASYETKRDAYLAGYIITWTRNLASAGGSWTIAHRAAKDMPEAVELASEALKRSDETLAPEEPNEGQQLQLAA